MKKTLAVLAAVALLGTVFTGCSTDNSGNSASSAASSAASTAVSSAASSAASTAASTAASDFDASNPITVISREDGSGTRGAFIELMGIEEKDASGNKVDKTTEESTIANSTNVVMVQVAGDPYGIGYISLGSLNDTVKALSVEGVEATVANIKAGSYKVSRPFNIATKGEPTGLAKDFINYILSKDGQAVINAEKYIAIDDNAPAFTSDKSTGKLVIAGSSSVTPVMEKLVEAYKKINTGADIDIQQSDSTSGMTAAMDGTCDIGMSSRELKDEEKAVLTPTTIAMDGIAVIVNKVNPLTDITAANVKSIYTGETTTWSDVK